MINILLLGKKYGKEFCLSIRKLLNTFDFWIEVLLEGIKDDVYVHFFKDTNAEVFEHWINIL